MSASNKNTQSTVSEAKKVDVEKVDVEKVDVEKVDVEKVDVAKVENVKVRFQLTPEERAHIAKITKGWMDQWDEQWTSEHCRKVQYTNAYTAAAAVLATADYLFLGSSVERHQEVELYALYKSKILDLASAVMSNGEQEFLQKPRSPYVKKEEFNPHVNLKFAENDCTLESASAWTLAKLLAARFVAGVDSCFQRGRGTPIQNDVPKSKVDTNEDTKRKSVQKHRNTSSMQKQGRTPSDAIMNVNGHYVTNYELVSYIDSYKHLYNYFRNLNNVNLLVYYKHIGQLRRMSAHTGIDDQGFHKVSRSNSHNSNRKVSRSNTRDSSRENHSSVQQTKTHVTDTSDKTHRQHKPRVKVKSDKDGWITVCKPRSVKSRVQVTKN